MDQKMMQSRIITRHSKFTVTWLRQTDFLIKKGLGLIISLNVGSLFPLSPIPLSLSLSIYKTEKERKQGRKTETDDFDSNLTLT